MRLNSSLLALSKPSKVLCFSVIVNPSFIPVKHGFIENSALVVFRINLIFWYWKRNHIFIFILPCSILSMKPPLDVSSRECTCRSVPSGEYIPSRFRGRRGEYPPGPGTRHTHPKKGTETRHTPPPPWTERHLWKHYLPSTTVAGGKNGCVMWTFLKNYKHYTYTFSSYFPKVSKVSDNVSIG